MQTCPRNDRLLSTTGNASRLAIKGSGNKHIRAIGSVDVEGINGSMY